MCEEYYEDDNECLDGSEGYYDPEDDLYDKWREEQAESLDLSVVEVLENYYKNNDYYKGNRDKIVKHVSSFISTWRCENGKD